jgi:uncharacterized damage-inducible protein DinB
MSIAKSILPELEHEMTSTRKVLDRVPDGRYDWKPHAKSMTLGRLASHLAELPGWGTYIMQVSELDIAPPGEKPAGANFGSKAEILALFDKNIAEAKAAIAAGSDADFMVPWTLKKAGNTIFTLPRVAVLRNMVLNHNVHHRAQLGVYFRLLEVAVPAIYGPSADEW